MIKACRETKMSRREGNLFVGRLSKHTRTRDLEDVFESYGRLSRCDLKYGAEMGYAFVDYEDRRDAEDALRNENGRDLCGSSIIVEWAKGNPRRADDPRGPPPSYGARGRSGGDDCFKCGRSGHWARECPDDMRSSYRRSSRRSRSVSRDRYRRSSYSRSRSRDRDSKRSRSRRHSKRSRTPSDRSVSKSPRNGASRSRSR